MVKSLYSVVIPVYNSEKTLAQVCVRTLGLFQTINQSVEIILVNDGSKDKSWETIRELKKNYPNQITGVNLSQNFGQHKALLCGISQTRGDYVITIDDDLQHCPEDIKYLIDQQAATGADLVYGIYKEKQHSVLRNLGSRMMIGILKHYANTPDQGSSFRLISRHVVDQMRGFASSFVFLDEILAWHCRSHDFAVISHEKRMEGRSGYSFFQLIAYAIQIIVTYTVLPLRIITWFGLTAFFVCMAFIIYFIYRKYTYGSELGFTALIVSLFMSTGLILFSIGIIGEYIRRLFILQNHKPPFIIKEIMK